MRQFDGIVFNQWPLFHVLFAEPLCNATTIVDWCEPWDLGLVNTLQKAVSHFPDGHIVVSEYIKLWLMKNCNIAPARIEFIPSAVRTSLYKANLEDKKPGKIVFIGRLAKHKRLDILIEAIKIARKTCPSITLDIIGNGPLYGALREEAKSYQSFIKVHGFLEDNEKIQHLKQAWALAMLSEREGFPRVVAEALAAATPIITSDSSLNGTRHVVRSTKAGVICSPTPTAVAEKITALSDDEHLWKELSTNASTSASRFDLSNVTKRLVSFIRNLSGVAS
jgi:glycosyltransferase involved in cell wall biosynthesis